MAGVTKTKYIKASTTCFASWCCLRVKCFFDAARFRFRGFHLVSVYMSIFLNISASFEYSAFYKLSILMTMQSSVSRCTERKLSLASFRGKSVFVYAR